MECVYFFATGFSRREGKEGDEKRDSQEVSGGLQVCLSPIEKKNIAVVCELLCELALGNVTFASLLFVSVAKVWEGGRASFSKKKKCLRVPLAKRRRFSAIRTYGTSKTTPSTEDRKTEPTRFRRRQSVTVSALTMRATAGMPDLRTYIYLLISISPRPDARWWLAFVQDVKASLP